MYVEHNYTPFGYNKFTKQNTSNFETKVYIYTFFCYRRQNALKTLYKIWDKTTENTEKIEHKT